MTIMRRSTAAAVVLAALALTACDSMTGGVPQVAGTYTGPVVLRFPSLGTEFEGSARLTAVQSGAEVTVHGSLTLLGVTTEVTAFTGTINSTGFFTVTENGVSGTASDPICGRYRPMGSSLTFSGREARLVENVGTDDCGNIHLSGTLTR
jgi:hypothetical protein